MAENAGILAAVGIDMQAARIDGLGRIEAAGRKLHPSFAKLKIQFPLKQSRSTKASRYADVDDGDVRCPHTMAIVKDFLREKMVVRIVGYLPAIIVRRAHDP
ncbi:hypothetical protein TWF106_005875 [Orbilia oligospora]|uniref:Uncharacterized protein n=1 Tax=Orbilia oligospora TaxID=2813651 RepID=A0A6G1M440_ORBOL|nr:hypothetical protein TWF788_009775 [Orbilia oligospora]KAF3209719.1 hypothetical protein TWF679_007256 [Orbilia oligospora]KAF3222095.1 hypothetical protein TWF106_005875 [Orbilia oligospora]KAF3227794.1 hypothetical protein TWF191_003316 [Orbilia oligospora]KAF3244460.1 hypothetical protein TWF192_007754 [Orbilia oligospora]